MSNSLQNWVVVSISVGDMCYLQSNYCGLGSILAHLSLES